MVPDDGEFKLPKEAAEHCDLCKDHCTTALSVGGG